MQENNYDIPVKFRKQKKGDLKKRTLGNNFIDHLKKMFRDDFSGLFRINLVMVFCALPLIYILFNYVTNLLAFGISLPYSSFLGAGYPLITDVSAISFESSQAAFMKFIVIALPAALFITLYLLQMAHYETRNFIWSDGTFKFKRMFKTFKFNAISRIWPSLITAAGTMGFAYLLYLLRGSAYLSGWGFVQIIEAVLLGAGAALFYIISLFALSINMTYKENIFAVYYDAIILTFKYFVRNLLIFIIISVPAIIICLLLTSQLVLLMLLVFVFAGFIFMGLCWESYVQAVFSAMTPEKTIYGKSKKQK